MQNQVDVYSYYQSSFNTSKFHISVNLSTLYSETYYLNLDDKQWTQGPDMSTKRYAHTCSLINSPSQQIVIVGGKTVGDKVLNSVDIYDLETNTKRIGIIAFHAKAPESTRDLLMETLSKPHEQIMLKFLMYSILFRNTFPGVSRMALSTHL